MRQAAVAKRNVLGSAALEISQRMAADISSERSAGQAPTLHIRDLLLQSLADRVALRRSDKNISQPVLEDEGLAILHRIESKLIELSVDINGSIDKDDRMHIGIPREARNPTKRDENGSKYNKIESMLRYVEADDDKTGVRLVIMNFND